ncbi:MAG TPA: hypothetical protein VFT31_07105 [Kribbella sp.]|nr:hypothetical protein [Kribbella sp.]
MAPREKIITHRGRSNVNQRTWNMIEAAEKLAGFKFVITQGSYNKGGVRSSAGTHDGGGVVDIRARDLGPARRGAAVLALRKVGFAAWLRTPEQANWPYHIHAVAKGDKDLAAQAKAQVAAYLKGRNGLKRNLRDDGPPGFYGMTWDLYQQLHRTAARVSPGDTRPRNSRGQLCLSYKAIQYAGVHRSMSGVWAAHRNSAHRSIKALFPSLKNQPDSRFRESWLYMERAIHRNPPNAVADVFSWYWFVGRVGFVPPDVNDWPPRP